MILTDVNILVYAFRTDAPDHIAYRKWLEATLNSSAAYGYSDIIFSGFLRIVTHPKVFSPPSDLATAFAFIEAIRSQPNAIQITPGARHWEIFTDLCSTSGAKGNLIPDAYLAALAIESGSEWMTTDRDYSRFRQLNWRHPLAE